MAAPTLILITQPGCTPCARVKRILTEIKEQPEFHKLVVEEVTLSSERGMRFAVKHQILYPPAIVIGDKLVAKGKIYYEQLKESIRSSFAEVAKQI